MFSASGSAAPAGATSASARTQRGYSAARFTDMAPPSELPTTKAGSPTTCST